MTIYTTEEATEAVADWLHCQGAGGVSIEESGALGRQRDLSYGQWYDRPLNDIPEGEAVMKAYFAEGADVEPVRAGAAAMLAELPACGIDPGKAAVTLSVVRDEQWADAWKTYFKPTKISERLVIQPTWETYEAKPHETVIRLDPGMAFGTGAHATTALCMRALEAVVRRGDRVVDVGTGSGILAITAAYLGAGRVLALDLDPVAVSSAKDNVRLNGLEGSVAVERSDLLGFLKSSEDTDWKLPVHVIVANILAEIVVSLADDAFGLLDAGGAYVVSGIIESKEREVEDGLKRAGFAVTGRDADQGWVALVARKQV